MTVIKVNVPSNPAARMHDAQKGTATGKDNGWRITTTQEKKNMSVQKIKKKGRDRGAKQGVVLYIMYYCNFLLFVWAFCFSKNTKNMRFV